MNEALQNPLRNTLTLRQLLALVAVWAVACAWPTWISSRPHMPGGWGGAAFFGLFYLLPVGFPLTLLVLRGRRVLSWMGIGAATAAILLLQMYLQLKRGHRSMNGGEAAWLTITLAGLLIGSAGAVGLAWQSYRARQWWNSAAWLLVAMLCGGAFVMLRWVVLYAG